MRGRAIFSIAIVGLGLAAPTQASECVGFPLKHYIEYAGSIFAGRLATVERRDENRAIFIFDVSRVWKGSPAKRTSTYQGQWSSEDFRFPPDAVGKEYLIFANRLNTPEQADFRLIERDQALRVPMCGGGTRGAPFAAEDIRELGPGRAPR